MVATAQQTPGLNDLRWLVDEAVPGDSLLFFYSRIEKSGETCGLQQRNLGFHGDLMTFYGISLGYIIRIKEIGHFSTLMVHYLAVFAPCTSGAKFNTLSNEQECWGQLYFRVLDLAPVNRPQFDRFLCEMSSQKHPQGHIELSWKSLGSSPTYFVIGHTFFFSFFFCPHRNIKSQENILLGPLEHEWIIFHYFSICHHPNCYSLHHFSEGEKPPTVGCPSWSQIPSWGA